ncbi:MAG: enoyl-CoA hydratase/isomerase family protein [Deltaproteobacteria bacterium]|nr:MAG: enoyl-CoA hydratase/isomerase family protein [Deltaproteobacteria bacterium]
MGHKLARYAIKDLVATVTIDHPPMNALDVATKEAIGKAFMDLDERRKDIRVVILKGAGEKAFAAGADIKAFLELTPETAKRRLTRSHELYGIVENFQWPVIAAIHGFCLGGGLELALCCDIRYATESAKFGFPEVNLSVFPGNGGTQRARSYVPLGKLKELTYTGAMIDAHEALKYGLIEKVVPDPDIMEAAMDLAATIMKKGPLAIAAAKKVLNRTRDLPLAAGLELESDFWAALTGTEDMKEGARAFIEKRKPEYKGT